MSISYIPLLNYEYMPVGLYTRKGANGRRMYFRNGKLISKKSYDASRKRSSTRKGQRRKTARRAYTGNPKRRNMARKLVTPHPSITGMAAGFSIFDDLNGGNGASVTDEVMAGNYSKAITELGNNAQKLVKTPTGRSALIQAVGIAAVGAWARKALPGTKIGSTRHYFRI